MEFRAVLAPGHGSSLRETAGYQTFREGRSQTGGTP